MKEIKLDEMLNHIYHSLETSVGEKAAYTMLIGAGFSYGVIPTAKQILQDAPVWLHKRKIGDVDKEIVDKSSVYTAFWKTAAEQYLQGNDDPQIRFNEGSYFPDDDSVTNAYQYLMSNRCSGGLISPSLRLDYIRSLHKSAVKKNNQAHLYLASLLNQQKKDSWKFRSPFCKTILTTNFDPLLQDALQLVNALYYMSDRPDAMDYLHEDDHHAIHLVYLHGSMHRYMLLNGPDEIKRGTENSISLKPHFEHHGIIVIGYGGGWEDAAMKALHEAAQFSGNLYWCSRKGDVLPETVQDLLNQHAGCAYKVIIPHADEAMYSIFQKLTGLNSAELLDDPISILMEQLHGLSFTESKTTESVDLSTDIEGIDSKSTTKKADVESEYIDSFDSKISSTLARLKMAQETYLEPEMYDKESSGKGASENIKVQAVASKYMNQALGMAIDNDLNGAIDLWSKILEISDVSIELKAGAMFNRGKAYGLLESPRIKDKIADYTTIIEMPGVPGELKAGTMYSRGIAYGNMKPPRIKDEIADYSGIIIMSDVSTELKAKALINRGVTYGDMKPSRIEDEIADYAAVIKMPDVPVEQKAKAFVNRGRTYVNLKLPRIKDAIDDFTAVIEMPDLPEKHRVVALLNRALAYDNPELAKSEDAIADYATIIKMPDVSAKQKAEAYGNLGLLLFINKDDVAAFLEHAMKAIEYDGVNYVNRYNLGLAKLFVDKPKEAIDLCVAAVDECSEVYLIDYALDLLRKKEELLPEKSKEAYTTIIQTLTKHRIQLEIKKKKRGRSKRKR